MKSKMVNKNFPVELMLFHGCRSQQAAKSIKDTGFDIKYARAGMFGTGLYFGTNSLKTGFGYATYNNDGTCSIFIVKVLIGDAFYFTN